MRQLGGLLLQLVSLAGMILPVYLLLFVSYDYGPLGNYSEPGPWNEGSSAWILLFLRVLLAWLLFYVSRRVWRIGYRMSARGAARARRWDARPPVLYLRSFLDDGRPFSQLSRILGRPLRVLLEPDPPTLEEFLETWLSRKGPVLAIGRPGERLPPRGAAREYVNHDAWQSRARALMDEAGLIVLCVGPTEGLAWEFRCLVENVPPEKVLLVFPSVGEAELEATWRTFATNCRGVTCLKLPDHPGTNALVAWFTPDWDCRILRRKRLGARRFPRTESDYRSCLKEALRRLKRRGVAERTIRQGLRGLSLWGLGALVTVLIALPFWYYEFTRVAAVLSLIAAVQAVLAIRMVRFAWSWSPASRPWLFSAGTILLLLVGGSSFVHYRGRVEKARQWTQTALSAVPASEIMESGPLRFRLAAVEVATPYLRSTGPTFLSSESSKSEDPGETPGLIVRIEITNASDRSIRVEHSDCRVFEDVGSTGRQIADYSYPIFPTNRTYSPVGQIGEPTEIPPGQSEDDVWVFTAPEASQPGAAPRPRLLVEYQGRCWWVPPGGIRPGDWSPRGRRR